MKSGVSSPASGSLPPYCAANSSSQGMGFPVRIRS